MTAVSVTAVVAAYALGSVPVGLFVARLVSGRDVRRQGSGGTGATNVLRAAGPAAAAVTLTLDGGKGAAAVLLAGRLAPDAPAVAALAAVAVVAGAIWPIWLGFRGGKGVAAGAGALGVLAPGALVAALVAFGAALGGARWVSAASMIAAVVFPVAARVLGSATSTVVAGIAVALLVLWAHRENWARIRAGREPRWPFGGAGPGAGRA